MEIFYLGLEKVRKKFEIFLHLMCGNPEFGMAFLKIVSDCNMINSSPPGQNGHQFSRYNIQIYNIHVLGWLLKWLNLITAPGSVSNEPRSVTWLATKYSKAVSWRNHTENSTTLWPQNISFWPEINIPSSYFTILMLNWLEITLKLPFDSYVTAVKFLT